MNVYPDQLDCIWLASDRSEQVAAFVTAGSGPIPNTWLNDEPVLELAEQLIAELPKVSGVRLLVPVPRPDDFIAIAERGIFVYDWTDVHRTSDFLRAYEAVAVPLSPIKLTDLTVKLLNVVANVRLSALNFSGQGPLDVTSHLACLHGRHCAGET